VSHYLTLGVHKGASLEELKKAYRGLARIYHPDRTGNDPVKAKKMAEVNVAYGVLEDLKQRKEYDRRQALLNDTCPVCKGSGFTAKQKGFSQKIKSKCTACKGAGHVGK